MAVGPSSITASSAIAVGVVVQLLWSLAGLQPPQTDAGSGAAVAEKATPSSPVEGWSTSSLLKLGCLGVLAGVLLALWVFYKCGFGAARVQVAVSNSVSLNPGHGAGAHAASSRTHIVRRGKGRLESGKARPEVSGVV